MECYAILYTIISLVPKLGLGKRTFFMYTEWQTLKPENEASLSQIFSTGSDTTVSLLFIKNKMVKKIQEMYKPQVQRKLELLLLSGQPSVTVVKGSTWRLGLIYIL